MKWDLETDVLVVGTGGGALTAAIMAHDMGHTCWGMPNLEIKHGSR